MSAAARSPFFSAEAIYRAWRDCRRRKRNTPGAMAFEMRLADELKSLEEELALRTYRQKPCIRFAVSEPKVREIVASDFRDRVVHHLFVHTVEPDWERVFIHDSYACRKRKGTHAAVDRLGTFVRRASNGGQRTAFFLQLDIRNFFMSIDRSILLARLDRRLRMRFKLNPGPDIVRFPAKAEGEQMLPLPRRREPVDIIGYESLQWLARVIVQHDPLASCLVRGDLARLARIPKHKTLAGCRPGAGLPLGNLTSQFFANVYLDALDQFVKHVLKAKWYIRYVDDMVLIHESRDALVEWQARIDEYLKDVLRLSINPGRIYLRRVSSGIDFLGYIVHPDHRLVRRRVVGNLCRRLSASKEKLFVKDSTRVVLRYPSQDMDRLESVLNSYLAHFQKADARRLVSSIWRKHAWLGAFFLLDGNKTVRRDFLRRFSRGFRRQYAWFDQRTGGGVLFFQVGSHFELLNAQARRFGRLLGLKRIEKRVGFGQRCGFHRRYLSRFIERARAAGLPITVVRETGRRTAAGLRERRIVLRVIPIQTGMSPVVKGYKS